MNRAIKFRAWDPVNAQMFDHHSGFGVGNDYDSLKDYLESLQEDYVLMQWTGLKDSKGVDIYEGDVVRGICSSDPHWVCEGLQEILGKPLVGFIDYADIYAQFRFTTDGITYLAFPFGLIEPEVIGNVHENPELLNPTKRP